MPEDIAFLRAIQDRPDDDTTRLVYADWLEEQGGEQNATRAAFIRADCELANLPEEHERREELQARLRDLAASLPIVWRATVSKARIEKCAVEFELECPNQWDQLTPTHARSIRHCDACNQQVYYCASAAEARRHAAFGHCIAVDASVLVDRSNLNQAVPVRRLGRVSPPGRPAWDKPDTKKEAAHE
jgi:uncharacterized protein (TIGR02996 family)